MTKPPGTGIIEQYGGQYHEQQRKNVKRPCLRSYRRRYNGRSAGLQRNYVRLQRHTAFRKTKTPRDLKKTFGIDGKKHIYRAAFARKLGQKHACRRRFLRKFQSYACGRRGYLYRRQRHNRSECSDSYGGTPHPAVSKKEGNAV